jgi:dipicolinate synthase subunit B
MCGSFCTFSKVIAELENLKELGYDLYPIMSFASYRTDTRFGKAEDFIGRVEEICEKKIISTIAAAEPLGPRRILDILIVAPATGNTIAKLASGIADTPVTLSVKSHLRNCRPVLIAVSTNDALGQNAKNIGALMARKHIFFVPCRQDDYTGKPNSVVADFSLIDQSALAALEGKQLQPLLLAPLTR